MRVFSLLPSSLAALLVSLLLSGNVDAHKTFWSKKSLLLSRSGSESGSGSKYSAASNLMMKMGASSIDTPGAQCSWDGMSFSKSSKAGEY